MITAAASGLTEVAEELLSYFVDIGNKECFAALLYICFDLLRSDMVEELSWQHGLHDFYMPYKIQIQRSSVERVRVSIFHMTFVLTNCPTAQLAHVEKEMRERSKKDTQKEQESEAPIINPGFGGPLLITHNGLVIL
jgi:clathrin heavy chain